jgi:hypothetical protein
MGCEFSPKSKNNNPTPRGKVGAHERGNWHPQGLPLSLMLYRCHHQDGTKSISLLYRETSHERGHTLGA